MNTRNHSDDIAYGIIKAGGGLLSLVVRLLLIYLAGWMVLVFAFMYPWETLVTLMVLADTWLIFHYTRNRG